MEENYKGKLELIYDLIKLSRQSRMACKLLSNKVKVIPLANVDDTPSFNQSDLSFHPNGECGCISLTDDYIFGIRCDHLIWFEGSCEGLESFWDYKDCEFNAIMVCGNHKGIYMQKLLVFHED